jgi:hypothetical protein
MQFLKPHPMGAKHNAKPRRNQDEKCQTQEFMVKRDLHILLRNVKFKAEGYWVLIAHVYNPRYLRG